MTPRGVSVGGMDGAIDPQNCKTLKLMTNHEATQSQSGIIQRPGKFLKALIL